MRDGCTTESAVEGLEVGSSHEEKLKWHQREPSGRPPSLSRWQALDSASSVAAAYSVGRTEASAATNLLKSVSASTRNQLKELVRRCPTISIIRKHVNLEMSDNIRYQFNIVQYIYIYIQYIQYISIYKSIRGQDSWATTLYPTRWDCSWHFQCGLQWGGWVSGCLGKAFGEHPGDH